MTHRQKAEEVVSEIVAHTSPTNDWTIGDRKIANEAVASALKETEEETWKRAIGCVEKVAKELFDLTPLISPYHNGVSDGVGIAADHLREEAGKEGVEL